MKRLELLDYTRFFAALMVVIFHYTFSGIQSGKIDSISYYPIPSIIEITKYGYLGVELFFMISGYVIFFSAKSRSAAKFAESRAIRLYPAYWFAVLFTSYFALKWGGDLMSVSPTQIIANLSMIQRAVGIKAIDGVYWTLFYELTFYFAVSVILFFGLQKYLDSIFIYWPVLFCISLLLGLDGEFYLGNYFYYFCAGALFAVLADKLDRRAVVSLLVTYVLCVYFSTGKADHMTEMKGIEYSEVTIGLIVTSFFFIFIYQNSKSGRSLKLPMSRIAGALTYPVYLIHAHFGYMFINQYATDENKLSIYALTIAIVFMTALAMHFFIENYLHFVWKKLFYYAVNYPISCAQEYLSKVQLAFNKRTS